MKRSRRLAVGTSQTLTLPSSEVVASTWPSGLNASASTRPDARRSIGRSAPVRRSRSTTLPSSFPKAARSPEGETAAAPEIGNVRTGFEGARVEQERARLAARDEERTPVVGEADEAAAGDHLRPPKLAAVGDPARDDHLVGRAAGAGDGLAREERAAVAGVNATSGITALLSRRTARARWVPASRRKSSEPLRSASPTASVPPFGLKAMPRTGRTIAPQ